MVSGTPCSTKHAFSFFFNVCYHQLRDGLWHSLQHKTTTQNTRLVSSLMSAIISLEMVSGTPCNTKHAFSFFFNVCYHQLRDGLWHSLQHKTTTQNTRLVSSLMSALISLEMVSGTPCNTKHAFSFFFNVCYHQLRDGLWHSLQHKTTTQNTRLVSSLMSAIISLEMVSGTPCNTKHAFSFFFNVCYHQLRDGFWDSLQHKLCF